MKASNSARVSPRIPPRILIVDDEAAILETMQFTFADEYEVFTSSDARRALELLDEHAPIAVVITDQRMPGMTGVEFLSEVIERQPETVRIMLTGFADMEATVKAINDARVYAYVNKPWEPDELKQVVKRAVEHHHLSVENRRLLEDLRRSNIFLEAVMDRLDTGAIALDSQGVVRAANQPARTYLGLGEDPRGESVEEILQRNKLEKLGKAVASLSDESCGCFEEVEISSGQSSHRLRISAQTLAEPDGPPLGQVILFREVSHEPLRRRFEELVADIAASQADLRARLEKALEEIQILAGDVRSTEISSPGMAELLERVARTQTAVQNWLDVDDTLAREDFPDAQLLLDRMRVAGQRWPKSSELPDRVRQLAARVESYYESGENAKQRVL